MHVDLRDESACRQLAARLVEYIQDGDILALNGVLGAGKTTFVKALVAALGGDVTQVQSPTYTLLHSYEAGFNVIHVDAYRLQTQADLEGLGFYELMDRNAIACVEWAERIEHLADPAALWQLNFNHTTAGGRSVDIVVPTERQVPEGIAL